MEKAIDQNAPTKKAVYEKANREWKECRHRVQTRKQNAHSNQKFSVASAPLAGVVHQKPKAEECAPE